MLSDPVLIAIIGLIGSIIGASITGFFAARKKTSELAVHYENRLTKLEERQASIKENMFTKDDRECLYSTKLKLDWFLQFQQEEAARALKNPPHLDGVLSLIETQPIDLVLADLTEERKQELLDFLDEKEKKEKSRYKKEHARFLKGLVKLEEKIKEEGLACELSESG